MRDLNTSTLAQYLNNVSVVDVSSVQIIVYVGETYANEFFVVRFIDHRMIKYADFHVYVSSKMLLKIAFTIVTIFGHSIERFRQCRNFTIIKSKFSIRVYLKLSSRLFFSL